MPRRPPGLARATLSLFCLSLAAADVSAQTSPPSASSFQRAPIGVPPSPGILPNLLLNGDFESRTQPPGCYSNVSNAGVTADLVSVTAFGLAEEIDIYADGTSCFYGDPPQSGLVKLAIHKQVSGITDAFSFGLSSPVVAGSSYDVSCYASANLQGDPNIGAVELGLSNNPLDFGTLVWSDSPAVASAWIHLSGTFIAPSNANYLTVRVGGPTLSWLHVDKFSLSPTGVVSTSGTSWGRLKSIYR